MANISPAIAAKSTLCVVVPASGGYYHINGTDDHSGPNFTKQEINVTGHTSPAIEYISSPLYDAGTFDFGLFFNPNDAIHSYLLNQATATSSVADSWMLIFSNGTKYAWSGSLLEFSIKNGNAQSDASKATAKIRISGLVSRGVTGGQYNNITSSL
jgi:hypothetical protein